MDIYKFTKIIASQTKLKLLSHFYSCSCNKQCVNNLVEKFGTSQANISKHLKQMESEDVLIKKNINKKIFYKLNEKFKQEWSTLLGSIIKKGDLEKYNCNCC